MSLHQSGQKVTCPMSWYLSAVYPPRIADDESPSRGSPTSCRSSAPPGGGYDACWHIEDSFNNKNVFGIFLGHGLGHLDLLFYPFVPAQSLLILMAIMGMPFQSGGRE
jgi:hypothetical protein